ncbi:MAG: hypothetical protein L6422_04365, partial [Candidatus Marinimicrobia bacterium]|nr:hypothetical protein [Candidatus Neomarinimicrobiota bacterium]
PLCRVRHKPFQFSCKQLLKLKPRQLVETVTKKMKKSLLEKSKIVWVCKLLILKSAIFGFY